MAFYSSDIGSVELEDKTFLTTKGISGLMEKGGSTMVSLMKECGTSSYWLRLKSNGDFFFLNGNSVLYWKVRHCYDIQYTMIGERTANEWDLSRMTYWASKTDANWKICFADKSEIDGSCLHCCMCHPDKKRTWHKSELAVKMHLLLFRMNKVCEITLVILKKNDNIDENAGVLSVA